METFWVWGGRINLGSSWDNSRQNLGSPNLSLTLLLLFSLHWRKWGQELAQPLAELVPISNRCWVCGWIWAESSCFPHICWPYLTRDAGPELPWLVLPLAHKMFPELSAWVMDDVPRGLACPQAVHCCLPHHQYLPVNHGAQIHTAGENLHCHLQSHRGR